ncbi:hypothetical protein LTR09_007083 [Extremus antarcticus]|uniref:Uncharacterized protein n=1 Tax=Extremus antarcticus TaxID=702011 RepID=A0AAJ0GB98_9PEZI|nr:hypothetical protein LTR09_007083 [Extremus antarcticus]
MSSPPTAGQELDFSGLSRSMSDQISCNHSEQRRETDEIATAEATEHAEHERNDTNALEGSEDDLIANDQQQNEENAPTTPNYDGIDTARIISSLDLSPSPPSHSTPLNVSPTPSDPGTHPSLYNHLLARFQETHSALLTAQSSLIDWHREALRHQRRLLETHSGEGTGRSVRWHEAMQALLHAMQKAEATHRRLLDLQTVALGFLVSWGGGDDGGGDRC